MAGTELRAAAQDRRHQARRRCTGPIKEEPSFQENAAEECQTERILECQANIVANGRRTQQNRTNRSLARREKNHFVANSSSLMLQHEAE